MYGSALSKNIKLALLIIALIISAGTVIYTQSLVRDLEKREKQVVELFAKGLEFIAQASPEKSQDFTFIFENIVKRIDFPLILTDSLGKINYYQGGVGVKNIEIDSSFSPGEAQKFLESKIKELEALHPPILVIVNNKTLNKIFYGNSDLINRLKYYPYLQILFALLFLVIAYVSFSYLKRTEQSNIWVGMAKETAHQLGTPISSLMGWVEILKLHYKDPDKVLDVADEMENDLERLNKIAKRFSKIGSKPELRELNVRSIIETAVRYYQKRIPQKGMNVELNIQGETEARARINPDLFEWVIENLIKNSLDAISTKNGNIDFKITQDDKVVRIEISDTGKGITAKNKKDVFRPGYSTKKRGWGLGLSLSKRIIESYHKGKIYVKNSTPNQGTTFEIILKK